jgi:hypothetical protein
MYKSLTDMKTVISHSFKQAPKIYSSLSLTTYSIGLICLVLVLGATAFKVKTTATSVNAQELIGTWQVDLRPTPDDAPYYQEFVVTAANGNSFTGTFYNSEIKQGKINTDWGTVSFAFVTSDGSGAYNTSGQLKNGKLEGSTHSLGRDFLMPWRAQKKQ